MKRLLYHYSNSDIKYIINNGIDINIDIISTIDKTHVAASESTPIEPVKDPQSNEMNIDAYNAFMDFIVDVMDILHELNYVYNIDENPQKSDSFSGYSVYFENVTKKFAYKDIHFPIRVKITDHLFDKIRAKQQEEYSRNQLADEFDVPYEYTQFVIQCVTINKKKKAYTSYSQVKADFMKAMYAVDDYIKNLEVTDIIQNYLNTNILKYREFAIAKDYGDRLHNVQKFNNIEDLLWYAIQQGVFAVYQDYYNILNFDYKEVYDYEDTAFQHEILYKGKQDDWVMYVLGG